MNAKINTMPDKVAIFTPKIGERSETFIKRHIDGLFPERTVVVAGSRAGCQWSVSCPSLVLDELPAQRYAKQLLRAFIEKVGGRCVESEVKSVKEFLRRHKVTVVMGEYLNTSLPWLTLCRDLGIRFYGHAHGYDVSILLRQEKWRKAYLQYRNAEGLIVVSQVSRMRLIELGLNADSIHVIPCGVSVAETLDKVHSNDGLIRCLAVGRMVSKKSPILCLDAFRRAAERIPALRLTYVGAGELLPSARHFVKAFGLSGKVALLGGQPHEVVNRLMKESDIYIQHSVTDHDTGDEEGLPVGILEAMAHGLPVISTRHAGIPEAVVENRTGLLVEEGDSEGMARCLCELAGDEELRKRMGREGWALAKEMFTWERERDRLRRIMGLTL